MIFYCDLQGNLKAFQNETVYQGSNNVTTIYVVAPFSRPVGLNISFTKPNKLVTSPAIMKWVGTLGNVKIPVSFVNIPEQFTDTYNVWAYALPYSITEQNGVVGVSVNAVIADSVDASGQQAYKGNLTTFTGQFTVAYSALPSPPTDIPTEWTQDKVLDLLNNYYNDAIQKIGEMNTLKTDAKDTLVKAINEVFDEIASTNATIGDLSTLTTDEKTTIVGAINEVDNHADNAQQTADNATELANTGISKAEQAQTTANNAVATANEAKTIAEQAKTIATNSVYSVSFEDIQSAVTALNGYDNAYFKVGNSIYLKQKDVPDMWVYAVASEYIEYTYTTDDDFVNALLLGTVQVGYYVLANLESTGDYDVLKNKPIINQDLSADGFTPVENTYYRHTGTTSETYTAGVVYFYNGTAYKAIDGAGGEVPTSLPATGAKITGNLPTSGWASDTPSWIGQNALTWTKKNEGSYYTQGGTEDLGLSAGGSYSAVLTIDGTDYSADVEGILPADGTVVYAGYFNNNNIELNIIDHCVGFDDNGEYIAGNGYLVMVLYMRGTVPSSVIVKSFSAVGGISAIISNSAIKVNSAVTMYIDYNGKIKAGGKADGSITVSADETPTDDIPYTLQVVETSAEGAFEIINSYVPTIPETPTALPQTASALKSGNLPTSGWAVTDKYLYNGKKLIASSNQTYICDVPDIYLNQETSWKIQAGGPSSYETYENQTIDRNTDSELYFHFNYVGYNSITVYITINKITKKAYAKTSAHDIYLYKIWNGNVGIQTYTISDTSITANSDVLMELTDEGGVKANALANGSITVIRDTVPTQPIPYTYKVKQTNASGQFTLVNHFVPSIPESPTSLPVTYKKVSGSLPTSGWNNLSIPLWEGNEQATSFANAQTLNLRKTWASVSDIPITGWTETYFLNTGTQSNIYIQDGNVTRETTYVKLNFGLSTFIYIYPDGTAKFFSNSASASSYYLKQIKQENTTVSSYTISDTDITENTAVKMYLTDAGGVKAQSKASGSITVIRDTVPTTAIPYEYEVEETSAEGVFEVINAYVPTKTSELTNDSGFITAADIGNALYPVGSIYMSVNNTNPSTFFGGTWEAWGAGKVPVGVDTNDTDFATVEKTGGEKTHTLTVNEMPKHSHGLPTFYSNPEKENITLADTAFNADKASDGTVSNGGQVISAGGGQAHNNLQPYITCYMWKRIN